MTLERRVQARYEWWPNNDERGGEQSVLTVWRYAPQDLTPDPWLWRPFAGWDRIGVYPRRGVLRHEGERCSQRPSVRWRRA